MKVMEAGILNRRGPGSRGHGLFMASSSAGAWVPAVFKASESWTSWGSGEPFVSGGGSLAHMGNGIWTPYLFILFFLSRGSSP